MTNLLEVREYDTITCNVDFKDKGYEDSSCFRYLERKYFEELEHFIKDYYSDESHADALDFMKVGYKKFVGDTITFNNYVGIIELPSGFQIEVLPKIPFDDGDVDYKKTKRIFLNMLRCLEEFEGRAFGSASLNLDRMNLYEIFISMYIKETQMLVKHGIKSNYIQKEENLPYYKGKLNVSQHIKENIAHKERFYMRYDEYQVNRAENKLVKAVLLKLQKITRSADNAREIRRLLTSFELVDVSVNYDKEFSQVSLSRDTKDYEFLIQWAKVFLLNKSFTTFSGDIAGKAILFPMEKVFEAFIARWVKAFFEAVSPETINVSAQDKGYYLFDEPKRFRLRPDIVVRCNEGDKYRKVIMDTKWKKLNSNRGVNYGISQSDMYQMYAYSKKYNTPEIWLIYPFHPGVTELKNISFSELQNEYKAVNVNVFFVDLADYKKSVMELRDKILIHG